MQSGKPNLSVASVVCAKLDLFAIDMTADITAN